LAQDVDESIGDLVDLDRSKLRVKSKWKPSAGDVPNWCAQRLSRFFVQVQRLFKQRKAQPNLLPHQEELLQTLPVDPNFLFPETDKGLGPCAVTHEQYTTVEHLTNKDVYEQLSETEALAAATALNSDIQTWLRTYKNVIGDQAYGFILNHLKDNTHSPFGQFYILYKIHKGKKNGRWPTRPVCSDVSSLPHGLGKWVTEQLTPSAPAPRFKKNRGTPTSTWPSILRLV
jgi:hypothetical protein